jgi:hypothetical protein
MSQQAENPTAAAVSKTAGAELRALLNLTHGLCAIAEDHSLTRRDLERAHDMACKVVKLTAELLSDLEQQRLRL